ncbi:MAG TPA: ATP-binding protein [Chitinophagaceae bacterium]|nr:ATP-binding protein [Chitinophagaceae bacterium]
MTKLTRLMYVLFSICMSVFIFLSVSYMNRVRKLDENIKRFEHSNNVLLAIEQINGILNANGSRLRNMLIVNQKEALPEILVGNVVLISRTDSLISITRDNPEQQEKARTMKVLLEKRFRLIQDSIPLYSESQSDKANFIEHLNVLRGQYDQLYKSIRESESRSLRSRRESRDRFDKLTTPALTILLIFASVLILSTFLYLIITLKRRIFFQNELQAKVETLNLANRELENLSRVTSHHIQEPMRKIRNFSTLLDKRIEQLPADEIRQIIGKIESNAGSLQVLAQNLVQYANLIQDQRPKEKVDLNELMDEVIYKLEDLIFETKTEIKRSTLPVIYAIPYQLFILFQELIRNSIHFSKPDETPCIEIFEWKNSRMGYTVIAIHDFGVGFSNDYAERIFRIFEQLEPRSAPGKGIGLAMCSRIMLNHGGRIWAEGTPGEGATFFLEFPGKLEQI